MEIIYHVFTNENDAFMDEYYKAKRLFNKWKRKYGCARLYKEEWDDPDDVNPIREDCILSAGSFPA